MEKIPTAKEFIETHNRLNDSSTELLMIEFAKLHVDVALKSKVKEMTERSYEDSSYSMKELDSFTKNSYPLENIK